MSGSRTIAGAVQAGAVAATRRRRADARIREQRVTALALDPCGYCGGTSEHAGDDTLACQCADRLAEIRARCLRIVYDHTPSTEDRYR